MEIIRFFSSTHGQLEIQELKEENQNTLIKTISSFDESITKDFFRVGNHGENMVQQKKPDSSQNENHPAFFYVSF